MKLISIIVIFLVFCLGLQAQWDQIKEVEIGTGVFHVDFSGNIYLVDNSSIKKLDSEGKTANTYTNSMFGAIHSVDVSNPFRILLFYADFNYVIFLDNTLSMLRDPIALDNVNLLRPEVLCSSQKGGFWVYDGIDYRIKYFNNQLEKQNESNSIVLKHKNDKPVLLAEFSDYICLVFEKSGVFVFDKFAGFVINIKVPGIKAIYATDNSFFYITDLLYKLSPIQAPVAITTQIPEQDYRYISYTGQRLYIVFNKILKIYAPVEN